MVAASLSLYALNKVRRKHSARRLRSSFEEIILRLGTLKGLSRKEIVEAVGQPYAANAIARGELLSWIAGRDFHIALLFDAAGICQGVVTVRGLSLPSSEMVAIVASPRVALRFCVRCGRQADLSARYCPSCGNQLTES